MNIKRFRTVCKISSGVLTIFAVFSIFISLIGLFTVFFGDGNFTFNYDGPSVALYTYSRSMNAIGITTAEKNTAALIMVPFTLIVTAYLYFKGAQLFKDLSEGYTPFTEDFAGALKRLSIVMIAADLLVPIVYYSILSFISADGFHFTLGFSSMFIIGVIFYAISEIFYYGIELQNLADETV